MKYLFLLLSGLGFCQNHQTLTVKDSLLDVPISNAEFYNSKNVLIGKTDSLGIFDFNKNAINEIDTIKVVSEFYQGKYFYGNLPSIILMSSSIVELEEATISSFNKKNYRKIINKKSNKEIHFGTSVTPSEFLARFDVEGRYTGKKVNAIGFKFNDRLKLLKTVNLAGFYVRPLIYNTKQGEIFQNLLNSEKIVYVPPNYKEDVVINISSDELKLIDGSYYIGLEVVKIDEGENYRILGYFSGIPSYKKSPNTNNNFVVYHNYTHDENGLIYIEPYFELYIEK